MTLFMISKTATIGNLVDRCDSGHGRYSLEVRHCGKVILLGRTTLSTYQNLRKLRQEDPASGNSGLDLDRDCSWTSNLILFFDIKCELRAELMKFFRIKYSQGTEVTTFMQNKLPEPGWPLARGTTSYGRLRFQTVMICNDGPCIQPEHLDRRVSCFLSCAGTMTHR